MSPDTVPAGAREIPAPDGLTTDQALSILAEYWGDGLVRQGDDDISVSALAEKMGKSKDIVLKMIREKPHPGYELVEGAILRNGRRGWILRKIGG